jgi:type III secretion inner rod protein HrpB2
MDIGAPEPMQSGPQGNLAQRFGELMRRTEGLDASPGVESSVLVDTIRSQDVAMRERQQHHAKLQESINDESLTPQQASALQNQMMVEMAATHYQFNACLYVAQNTKTGLQTLIKNQ